MRRWSWFAVLVVCGACGFAGCSDGGKGSDADAKPSSKKPSEDGGTASGGGGSSGHGSKSSGGAGHAAMSDAGAGSDPASDDQKPPPKIPGIMSLRIEPASLTVADDGVDPGESGKFKAIGTFADGEHDVTSKVSWTLADASVGGIDGGVFTSDSIGGQTKVRAREASVQAEADLTVTLAVQVSADGAPDGITDLFKQDPAKDTVIDGDDDSLRIVYPSHETMFPRNLERVDYQWHAGTTFDRFEVRFESDVALVRFYTADKHFLPDAQGWRWLADTHAGRSLQLSVRATSSTAPDTIARSQPITLYFSRSEVPGALYYWSTGSQGVMKGTISSAMAAKFYTDPDGTDTTCVACHTVSRNGQKLSAGYGGEIMRVISVPDRDLIMPADAMTKGAAYGWGTFDPPANRLLYANKGLLTLIDLAGGASPVAIDTGDLLATHPDWAPDGHHVAVAYGAGANANKAISGTSIARMSVKDDGTFGAPEVLLASADDSNDTLFFPSYSPDSKWIAFVHATGKSKDNLTSVISLLPADGGDPIALTRMNERVSDADGVTGIGNSMPTWAPSTKPDIFWLAFSSVRAYGDVIPAGGHDQLWAVAIDPTQIGTGKDPSFAAFWLPFQDAVAGNHRAFWAIDTEVKCPSEVETCDGLDNDCDGVVDNDCVDDMCRAYGESCESGADCCDDVPCSEGVCRVPLG